MNVSERTMHGKCYFLLFGNDNSSNENRYRNMNFLDKLIYRYIDIHSEDAGERSDRARIKWIVFNLYSTNNSLVSSSPGNLTTFNSLENRFLSALKCDFDTLIGKSPYHTLPRMGHRSSPQS